MSAVNEEKKTAHQGTASHKTEPCCHTTFDGKIVSMTGDKLVVANKEGKQCSHTLAKDAKLTRDGTKCNAADLKAGNKIRVTTKKDDHNVATAIESLDKHAEFAKCSS
jgi:hypothetical protein